MFKQLLVMGFIVLCSMGLSSAQEKTFDSELSGLRRNIIAMCAQLQAGQPKENQEQLLKEVDNIISSWEGITTKYKNNPPKEYSKDPAWQSYFDEALDNFKIMRQKAEGKDYKRAMQFCGQNCALFVKIHQVNGKTNIADLMFAVRQNVRLAVSMAKAGNYTGAKESIGQGLIQLKKIEKYKNTSNKTNEKENISDVKYLKQIFHKMKDIIDKQNTKEIDNQLKIFLNDFSKLYIKYI